MDERASAWCSGLEHGAAYAPSVPEIIELASIERRIRSRRISSPPSLAAALGVLTSRFAEMWLGHGAVDSTLEHAVDKVSRILTNAIRLSEA